MRNFRSLFLIITLMAACAESEQPPPAGILDPSTFTAVMIDVQLQEGENTQLSYLRNDASGKKDREKKTTDLYPEIFEKHNVDPAVFLKTYDYYVAHPGKMEKIFEQVLDSLARLEVETRREYNEVEKVVNDSLRAANQRKRDSLRVYRKLK